MKFKHSLLCVLAVGALACFTTTASAAPGATLLAKLNVSGKVNINQNPTTTNGKTTKLKSTTAKYNTKDIIKLLNSSPVFVSYLAFRTATNYSQIPSGAYLAADVYSSTVWVVLKNGTPLVRLSGYDAQDNYRGFGVMEFGNLCGDFDYNNSSRAGSEVDQVGNFYLSFDDYNSPTTSVSAAGAAEFKFKAGKLANSVQNISLQLKCDGTGNALFNGSTGVCAQTAKASGKNDISPAYWPFYSWY